MPTSQNAEKNASAGPKEPTRKADAEGAAADSTPAASAMAEVAQTVQQQSNRRAPPTQAPLSAVDEIQAQVTEPVFGMIERDQAAGLEPGELSAKL